MDHDFLCNKWNEVGISKEKFTFQYGTNPTLKSVARDGPLHKSGSLCQVLTSVQRQHHNFCHWQLHKYKAFYSYYCPSAINQGVFSQLCYLLSGYISTQKDFNLITVHYLRHEWHNRISRTKKKAIILTSYEIY